jgi:uncharacterized membrane protein
MTDAKSVIFDIVHLHRQHFARAQSWRNRNQVLASPLGDERTCFGNSHSTTRFRGPPPNFISPSAELEEMYSFSQAYRSATVPATGVLLAVLGIARTPQPLFRSLITAYLIKRLAFRAAIMRSVSFVVRPRGRVSVEDFPYMAKSAGCQHFDQLPNWSVVVPVGFFRHRSEHRLR